MKKCSKRAMAEFYGHLGAAETRCERIIDISSVDMTNLAFKYAYLYNQQLQSHISIHLEACFSHSETESNIHSLLVLFFGLYCGLSQLLREISGFSADKHSAMFTSESLIVPVCHLGLSRWCTEGFFGGFSFEKSYLVRLKTTWELCLWTKTLI